MARPVSDRVAQAIALIMGGMPVSVAARQTGANRSNLFRSLARAGLKSPVKGKRGRRPVSPAERELLAEG